MWGNASRQASLLSTSSLTALSRSVAWVSLTLPMKLVLRGWFPMCHASSAPAIQVVLADSRGAMTSSRRTRSSSALSSQRQWCTAGVCP
jgi:hypothetical protein